VDNTVKIFTNSDNKFVDGNATKKLELVWYNKTEQNTLLGFSDGEFNATLAKEKNITDNKIYYHIEWQYNDWKGNWKNLEKAIELLLDEAKGA
jgi:hypothetical protein